MLTAVKDVLEVVSVENLHERQIVVLLVREGDDEEDVLVLVELVADGRRQVGLKETTTDRSEYQLRFCSSSVPVLD